MQEVILFHNELTPNKSTSMFYTARSIIHEGAKRPDTKMVVLFPSDYGDPIEYWGPEAGDCDFFKIDLDKTSNLPLGYVNDSFRPLQRRSDYFVVLNQRLTSGPMLHKTLCKPFAGFFPTIVNYVTCSDLGADEMMMHPTTIPESLLAHSLFWNIFHNERHMKRVAKAMGQMFQPAVVRKFLQKSVAFNLGIDLGKIEGTSSLVRSDKDFVILYGGRPSSLKRLDLVVEICQVLFGMGVPVKLWLWLVTERVNNADAKVEALKRMPFVEVELNRRSEEFYAACKSADAFIGASKVESYGLSYVEMMYGGAVGVFMDADWVHAITPHGYPFITKSKADAVRMLKLLWQDAKMRKEHSEALQRFILAEHDREDHAISVVDACAKLSKAIRTKQHPKTWGDVL